MEPVEVTSAATRKELLRTLKDFYDNDGRTPFVLSLDGGGIYGLTEAIWLRKLCEAVPGFLTPGQVRIIAGCSAGAANALILALFESPREAVLDGVLERFWTRSGVLSNEGPVTRWTKGLTAMFGAEDEYGALHDVFGDKTLGDLHHRVLISTFNYTGASAEDHAAQGFGTPFDHGKPDWAQLNPAHMFRLKPPAPIDNPKAGQTRAHWKPKFFDNSSLSGLDEKFKVVDVAMAAMCVPGIRPFRGGLGDGGLMTADPSVGAIAHLLRTWEDCVDLALAPHDAKEPLLSTQESPREQIRRILADGERFASPQDIQHDFWQRANRGQVTEDRTARELIPDERLNDPTWVKARGKGILLSWFKVLSIGPGQALPAYGYANIDIGLMPAQFLPFNPFNRTFWPQSAYSLDQPASSAQYTISRLLSDDRYVRLNPDIMQLPTMAAAMMSVHPVLRAQIIREIYRLTESPKSVNAIKVVCDYLRDNPTNSDGLGDVWGTGWYQEPREDGSSRKERFAGMVQKWREERDAREAERLKNRPWNPWNAWSDAMRKSPWGAWMEGQQPRTQR